jgi:hypothetical protein
MSRKPGRTVQFFRLVIQLGKDEYSVTPFQPATTVARMAFRLRKQTRDHKTYEVRVTTTEGNRSQPHGDKSISRSKLWPCSLATQVPADASVD